MENIKTIPAFIFDELAGITTPASPQVNSSNIIKEEKEIVINSFNLTRFRNACNTFIPNDYYNKLSAVLTFIRKFHQNTQIERVNEDDYNEDDEEFEDEKRIQRQAERKEAKSTLDAAKRYFNEMVDRILKPFNKVRKYFKNSNNRITRWKNSWKNKIKRNIDSFKRRAKKQLGKITRSIRNQIGKQFRRIRNTCKNIGKGVGRLIKQNWPMIKSQSGRVFRWVKSRGIKLLKGIRRILQPAFEFFSRVFPANEPGSTKPSKLKSSVSKMTSRFINTLKSGAKKAFNFGKKVIPFIIKIVKKLAIKLAPKFIKIIKVFFPFVKKIFKKAVMLAVKAAASMFATVGAVATFRWRYPGSNYFICITCL